MWDLRALLSPRMRAKKPRNHAVLEMRGFLRTAPPSKSSALPFKDAKVTSISTKLSLVRDHYVDGVLGREIFPKITSIEHTDNPIAKVSDFFLRKATKTLDAICVLCETGFVEDALVLRARPETSLDIEA